MVCTTAGAADSEISNQSITFESNRIFTGPYYYYYYSPCSSAGMIVSYRPLDVTLAMSDMLR